MRQVRIAIPLNAHTYTHTHTHTCIRTANSERAQCSYNQFYVCAFGNLNTTEYLLHGPTVMSN